MIKQLRSFNACTRRYNVTSYAAAAAGSPCAFWDAQRFAVMNMVAGQSRAALQTFPRAREPLPDPWPVRPTGAAVAGPLSARLAVHPLHRLLRGARSGGKCRCTDGSHALDCKNYITLAIMTRATIFAQAICTERHAVALADVRRDGAMRSLISLFEGRQSHSAVYWACGVLAR